jgi:ABC-type antimicrobial peptide transport system permease subunit
MGIRLALGSVPGDLRTLVVSSGLIVAATGSMVGLVAAPLLSRLVVSLLFGVQPTDPVTLAGVIGIVLLVAAIASWIPASRATRVDPVQVLRAE